MRFVPPDLEPKLFTTFREGYTARDFVRDALSGVVVGIVALPLAIAFAIASGVRPEQGLYTAIIAGFVISAFGGSRVQIGGPTGAFVVLVSGVVARYGYEGLAVATLLAGAFLVVLALARLGSVIRFIPYPVTVGFTTGIAIIIAIGQLDDALGLPGAHATGGALEHLRAVADALGEVHGGAIAITLATIAIIELWPRVSQRLPAPLVALLVTTAAAHAFGLDIETIQTRFGSIPTSLPTPSWPSVDWEALPGLVSAAVSIALLAAIESLLSAVVADGLVGGRHRSNAELLAQGLANIASPLFGGIPATGAIARTATNVRNGGRTPIAGMVHALTLVLILVVAARWASLIPMATLAGILIVVAYNMSEWRAFLRLFRAPRSDVLVLLTTFGLTVAVDLTVAIQVGVVLAALLFMRRMAEVTRVEPLSQVVAYEEDEVGPEAANFSATAPSLPDGLEVFEINGPFCFGAARTFTETLLNLQGAPRVVLLRMRHVLAMDATGLEALEEVRRRLERRGTILCLSGVRAQPLEVMHRSGIFDRIGEENVFERYVDARAHAERLLDGSPGAAD